MRLSQSFGYSDSGGSNLQGWQPARRTQRATPGALRACRTFLPGHMSGETQFSGGKRLSAHAPICERGQSGAPPRRKPLELEVSSCLLVQEPGIDRPRIDWVVVRAEIES